MTVSRRATARHLLAAGTLFPLAVSLGCARTAVPRAPTNAVIDLAVRGQGAPVYRIPALAVTTRGTLLAAYDARPTMADVPSHIAIVLRRSDDGGRTWGPQQTVRADTAPLGYGDPSLLVDRQTGRIFLFHAASVRQGFHGATTGNRDDDPNVLHVDVSVSDDDGRSWRHRRLTSQVKDSAWGGLFASSGTAVQLERGPHAGRLVQQYVIRRPGGVWAASLVSDDHGATWRMGALVGPGVDENKTVELPDGTLLLDSRARPFRLTARSSDGGISYGPLTADPQRVDPANNGAIVAVRSGRRQALLFSNTADSTARRNLTLRLSCDDGRSWPYAKVLVPGPAAYSTLVALGNDVGVLFERGEYAAISFVRVPVASVGACR